MGLGGGDHERRLQWSGRWKNRRPESTQATMRYLVGTVTIRRVPGRQARLSVSDLSGNRSILGVEKGNGKKLRALTCAQHLEKPPEAIIRREPGVTGEEKKKKGSSSEGGGGLKRKKRRFLTSLRH